MISTQMRFYVSHDKDGNLHVQNFVLGMQSSYGSYAMPLLPDQRWPPYKVFQLRRSVGQHHVHSPAGFERWRKDTDDIHEIKGLCDCGLAAGMVRDHTGRVSELGNKSYA